MIDEKTITMGLGKNRAFVYLQENPNGVFMIMEPGKTPTESGKGSGNEGGWRGSSQTHSCCGSL